MRSEKKKYIFLTTSVFFSFSQMFITSVLWSDQDDIIVYRTLKEFQKLHVSIKTLLYTTSEENHEEMCDYFM